MHTIFKVFVDTNVYVAIRDETDSTHKKAIEFYELLRGAGCKFYTSSDIIAESLTVISKKLGKKIASEFLGEVENSTREIFVDEVTHKETRGFFKSVKSKNISFVDCSSVIAMKRNKIDVIFSFDEDFRKMGVSLVGDVI